MKLHFKIHFYAAANQYLRLRVLQDDAKDITVPMHCSGDTWQAALDFFGKEIQYVYELCDAVEDAVLRVDCPHHLPLQSSIPEYFIHDVWNERFFPENFLGNKNLVPGHPQKKAGKTRWLKKHTHVFRVMAPLQHAAQRVVVLGNTAELGNWELHSAVDMAEVAPGCWELALTLPIDKVIKYRYGIRCSPDEPLKMETGKNRYVEPLETPVLQIIADHQVVVNPNIFFRGAGVAIPVFSLRTEESFGVGDFLDLKKMGDWAAEAGLKIVQILPINDTTTDGSWADSYPYAAISVHALHPLYLRIDGLSFALPKELLPRYIQTRDRLNATAFLEYPEVLAEKIKFAKEVFVANFVKIKKNKQFTTFFTANESWLKPYCAFCVLRDRHQTADFSTWKTHRRWLPGKIEPMFAENHKLYENVLFYAWLQYELHTQLLEAVAYLHKKNILLKGDLPIGIFRNSVDAWQHPELFDMHFQTGAPPDDFSVVGQNWGFPTYNWIYMQRDNFAWWRERFQQMQQYFDALRIDHILGFFRIWKMPWESLQGVLGYFDPALGFTAAEIKERFPAAQVDALAVPQFTIEQLENVFPDHPSAIERYFTHHVDRTFTLRPEIDTQRKISSSSLVQSAEDKEKLLDLAANVLLIKVEDSSGNSVYHPRIHLYKTLRYSTLSEMEKEQWYALHQEYFFQRQEELWYQTAKNRLAPLLDSTQMLICAEDLGMVPAVVPHVLRELGIAGLKVQRMPPPDEGEFYDPRHAGYLNVLTTGTHDTSTLRQWWQEDRKATERYFWNQIHQTGTPPSTLHPLLAKIILQQHVHTDAMLAIFPLQDILAALPKYATLLPETDERINIPAVYPHPWKYRMPITLETLVEDSEATQMIREMMHGSGRDAFV